MEVKVNINNIEVVKELNYTSDAEDFVYSMSSSDWLDHLEEE